MFDKYLVRKDDTLSSIASLFNVDKSTLMDINNIYFENNIREGMELIVPTNSEVYFNTYVIEKGDSLYKIAERYNINPTLLAALNGIDMDNYIYPGQEILIPKSGYSYYITAEGDTLKNIEDTFGISETDLLKQNKTIYLLPNQVLITKR